MIVFSGDDFIACASARTISCRFDKIETVAVPGFH